MSSGTALVYSTDGGRTCPECRQPLSRCSCSQVSKGAVPGRVGAVRVERETNGRKGKGVTVVRGLPLDTAALNDLSRQLKGLCGSGGTVKDGVIEVQGEHRDRIVQFLQDAGWEARRAGG